MRAPGPPWHWSESSCSPNLWRGDVNPVGVAFAAFAAVGWAAYILLTRRLGGRFAGTGVLSLTVPIAAATAPVAGIPQAVGHLTLGVIATAAGLAILLPGLPYALEMPAPRQMRPAAFGALMALEPAIGLTVGLLVLRQTPTIIQLTGILLVVLAGAAAQRGGRHDRVPRSETAPARPGLDPVG